MTLDGFSGLNTKQVYDIHVLDSKQLFNYLMSCIIFVNKSAL